MTIDYPSVDVNKFLELMRENSAQVVEQTERDSSGNPLYAVLIIDGEAAVEKVLNSIRELVESW